MIMSMKLSQVAYTVQRTVQYRTVPYSTVPYSTVQSVHYAHSLQCYIAETPCTALCISCRPVLLNLQEGLHQVAYISCLHKCRSRNVSTDNDDISD